MTRMPKTQNETHVKKAVKKLLDDHDWYWWMTPANGFGKSGISDICATKHGMFMAIETKLAPNKASPMQKAFLRSIASCEHFAFIVSDKTLDAFAMFLTNLDKSVTLATESKIVPTEIGGPMADAMHILTEPWLRE